MFLKYLKKLTLKNPFTREPVDIEDAKDQFLNIQNRAWKQAFPKKLTLRTYCTFKEYLSVENYVKYNFTTPPPKKIKKIKIKKKICNGTVQIWNTTTKHRNPEIPKLTSGRQTLHLMRMNAPFSLNAVCTMIQEMIG